MRSSAVSRPQISFKELALVQRNPCASYFLAVVTSLVAAGMAFVLAARDPFDADFASLSQISVHLVSSLAAVVELWAS